MNVEKFFRGAKNHLTRGYDLYCRGQENPAYFFYSALELRFGIESRYREYLEYQSHVAENKKKGWQLAKLSRDVEDAFNGCKAEVRVTLYSSGYPVMLCRYTPVTPELRSIGERLGNYLHAPKSTDLLELEQWQELDGLLDTGFKMLGYSCEGNLLGVPMKPPGSQSATFNMSVTDEQRAIVDELRKRGGEIVIDVEHRPPPTF